jgi:hypothetical protein
MKVIHSSKYTSIFLYQNIPPKVPVASARAHTRKEDSWRHLAVVISHSGRMIKTILFRTCNCENRFYALPADRVVDHAKVLSGVVHLGLLDYEGAANLLHAVVQLDKLLVVVGLQKLVPPKRQGIC